MGERRKAGHCKKNDFKNPAYASSLPFDGKATDGKTAFVRQWNGLARKYGLASYPPSQICRRASGARRPGARQAGVRGKRSHYITRTPRMFLPSCMSW